ncbi:MAG: DUF2914 domain-containing protein [Polyangiaceae bacterium]|nr:DUF2914 domain-containing protein [Polyangiaceae bacterium]
MSVFVKFGSFKNLASAFLLSSACFVALGCGGSGRDKAKDDAAKPTAQEPRASTAPSVAATTAAVEAPPVVTPVASAPSKADAPAAKPKSKPKADGGALSVKKLVVAKSVEKSSREPQGVGTSFKKGEFEKLFAFVELANPGDESEVVVSFDPPSDKPAKGRVRLDVGTSPRWRTWATTKGIDEAGTWTAVVSTVDGRELAREPFEVL